MDGRPIAIATLRPPSFLACTMDFDKYTYSNYKIIKAYFTIIRYFDHQDEVPALRGDLNL